MRSLSLWLLLFISMNIQPQEKKIQIALLDLEISGDAPTSLSPVLSGLIRRELLRSESYELMDRGNMEVILKEQDFTISESCSNKECAVQIGQLLGVEKMLFGSVGTLGKKIIITLQMADVSTGKIERIENETHIGAIEDLDEPLRRLARKFIMNKESSRTKREYKIYVTSEPEGAGVYIDDELKGSTPVTLELVDDNVISVSIRANNYQDWFQEVKPKENETVIVSAKLLEGLPTVKKESQKVKKPLKYTKSKFYWLFTAGFVSPTGGWKKENKKAASVVETSFNYRLFPRFETGLVFKGNVFNLGDTVADGHLYKIKMMIASAAAEIRCCLLNSYNHDFYMSFGWGVQRWEYNISREYQSETLSLYMKNGSRNIIFLGTGYRYKYITIMTTWNHTSGYYKPSPFIEIKFGIDLSIARRLFKI